MVVEKNSDQKKTNKATKKGRSLQKGEALDWSDMPNKLPSLIGLEYMWVQALICLGNNQSSPQNHQREDTKV